MKTYNSINRENLKHLISISLNFVNSNIIIVVAAIIIIQAKNVNLYILIGIRNFILKKKKKKNQKVSYHYLNYQKYP